ncbi:hypothetical protein MTsPCn9_03740 [Croceitalea sp. MTPC9]|uniref:hypothetical protein n=1 Tax=unclassified Croceitalea TaxID=2632280 RepID=UPI002B3DA39A|nr:hypothetical protein MTsPCn6_04970 [Croceitalea sp. MTPC6]GMN15438.1 hypothetical protein MTsPCn9_03740 [Croceitalea sp. MTPC9]
MLKYILIILTGLFFLWLAKWNLRKDNYDEKTSKANYWIWRTTAIIFISIGGVYLGRELLFLL